MEFLTWYSFAFIKALILATISNVRLCRTIGLTKDTCARGWLASGGCILDTCGLSENMEDTKLRLGLTDLLARCVECHEVGSRVTCNPPALDTDHDFLCLTSDWREFVNAAMRENFVVGGSIPSDELELRKEQTLFTSMRRKLDSVNLIITDSADFAKRFMAATSVAKRLNLRVKKDRIALFQAVLYGNGCRGPT